MREAVRALIHGRSPASCVVVAELGVNHNGSCDRALQLLRAAIEAGADAVKLQLFVPAELCSRIHRADELRMLESLRLSDADHARILAAAREHEMPVFATPFDLPSLELLCRLDIPLVKLGSGEVTHTPLLTAAARTGKPLILSTGGCGWIELDRAVYTLRDAGCRALALLHCTSAYPPPDEQVNLRVIPELAARYQDAAIGFSDHTLGADAAVTAVSLGAKIIEKHLTLDTAGDGPDHAASADPAAFATLVRAVRRTEAMLGDGLKRVQACEGVIGRSIVAARDLDAGHELALADLAFKRPGRGIRPSAVETLIGRRLIRPITADELIAEGDFEPSAASRFIADAPAFARHTA